MVPFKGLAVIADDALPILNVLRFTGRTTELSVPIVALVAKKVQIKDEVKIVSKSTGNTTANYWQITDLTAKEDFVTPIQASAYEETNSIAYLEWKPNLMYQMYNASIGSRQGFGGGPPLLPYFYLWPMLLSVFLHRGEWYFRVLDLIIEDAASREYSITDEIIMYKPIRETTISTYTRTVKVEIIETFF